MQRLGVGGRPLRAFGDDPSRSVFFFTMVERTGRLAHEERSGKLVLLVLDDGGGAYRDRTDDPLLAKQMLSQLS